MTSKTIRLWGWFIAMFISPLIVMSVELCLTRLFGRIVTGWDYAGVTLSVVAGLCCLWRLPMTITARAGLTAVFIPVSILVLLFYSVLFVCFIFGDCP